MALKSRLGSHHRLLASTNIKLQLLIHQTRDFHCLLLVSVWPIYPSATYDMTTLDNKNNNTIKINANDLLELECHQLLTPNYIKKNSFFYEEITERMTNSEKALNFYQGLDYDQYTTREAVLFWENHAASLLFSLVVEFSQISIRTISLITLAKKEMKYITDFFESGTNETLFYTGSLNTSQIPIIYRELLYGYKRDIFNYNEIGDYKHQEWGRSIKVISNTVQPPVEQKDKTWYEENKFGYLKNFPLSFNTNWVSFITIQVLVWFMEILEKTIESGKLVLDFSLQRFELDSTKQSDEVMNVPHIITLVRVNRGYRAIKISYTQFTKENEREPTANELMMYMINNNPKGHRVEGVMNKDKTEMSIRIDGQKPISLEAFDKRYKRYLFRGGLNNR